MKCKEFQEIKGQLRCFSVISIMKKEMELIDFFEEQVGNGNRWGKQKQESKRKGTKGGT